MRILFWVALLAGASLLPAASQAQDIKEAQAKETGAGKTPGADEAKAPPTIDQLVRYFDTVVFQSEFKTAKSSKIIKKWTGPLRVAIRTFDAIMVEKDGREVPRLKQVKVKKPHVRFIQKHLNSLIQATGLKTEDAKKNGKPANFIINFVPRQHMANPHLARADPRLLRKMAAEGGCYFLLWPTAGPETSAGP